jgi:hypothetical protein
MLQAKSDYQAKARWAMLFRSRRQKCFRSDCQCHKFRTHKNGSAIAGTVNGDAAQANAAMEKEMEDGNSIWDRLVLALEQQWRDDEGSLLALGRWW